MSILRNCSRRLSRSLRLYSTESMTALLDPTLSEKKKHKHVKPLEALRIENFKIAESLTNDKAMDRKDWTEARDEILSSKKLEIDEARVDMLIVNYCLLDKKVESAMAYLRYLWERDEEMLITPMITYLKLCYLKEDKLNETEKKYLIDMYDVVRNKYPVMESFTGECCILGISMTERWKESLEILEMIKFLGSPRRSVFSAIISAAFKNDEPEIGWKYLVEGVPNFSFENHVYTNYFEYCKRHFEGERLEREIEKMFELWGDYDVIPNVGTIEACEKIFNDLGWSTERTSIRDVGICRGCSDRLKSFKITDEEFEKLTRFVYDRVIVGDDVYRKTTPKELKHFLMFVKQNKPWDIVIDGLNVAYLTNISNNMNGHLVTTTVNLCLEMGKKVLVLGRKHMSRWPTLDLSFIKQKAHIFLADNGSADDPYLLYASLISGPNTKFVSRDLMRQHKFLLEDPTVTRIFKHWQMTHQYFPEAVRSRVGALEMRLKHPPKYLPVAQKNANGWHVPFTFDSSIQPSLDHEPPKSWVCFRKNKPCRSIVDSSIT